jgi:hypothetical protein
METMYWILMKILESHFFEDQYNGNEIVFKGTFKRLLHNAYWM